MRLGIAVSMALAGASLALPSLAQVGSGKVPTSGFQMTYAVEIGGTGGVVQGITGLPFPGKPSDPGKGPENPAATLVLHITHGLPTTFYDWISSAFGARPMRQTISIRGTDTTGRVGQAAVFSGASISSVAFPAYDSTQSAPMAVDVTTQGQLKVEAGSKPSGSQQLRPTAQWPVSGYRLQLEKFDTSSTPRVEAFRLTPGGAVQLQLTTHGPTTAAFRGLFPDLKGQKPVPPPPFSRGNLLLSAGGHLIAVIWLEQVQVTTFTHASRQDANGTLADVGHATLTAKVQKLEFSPEMTR